MGDRQVCIVLCRIGRADWKAGGGAQTAFEQGMIREKAGAMATQHEKTAEQGFAAMRLIMLCAAQS